MPTVRIDGREIRVEDGLNLIQAAERLDIEIPHYCYHPALSVSGNCRMCLVEIEKQPKLQIACNTPVADGMVVYTASERVQAARRAVLEFLLLNHPLDCPICDQAGECKLQDYYMDYARHRSRVLPREKVRKRKVVDLGPLVVLDQERCILCARCTRFLQEVTGTGELGIFGRGDRCYIDLFPGKRLENPYSGNVVDICPVGALTNKDFRFKARVWYLEKTESVCPFCANGCNINIYHRQGTVYRFQPRYNPEVNQYWMCDQGRRGVRALQGESRLLKAFVRTDGRFRAVGWGEGLAGAVERLNETRREHGDGAVGGVVSALATNEEAYLFRRLLAEALGSQRVASIAWTAPGAYGDDFLVKTDKNPNARGLEALGLDPQDGAASVGALLKAVREGKVKALVLFAADLAGWLRSAKTEAALESVEFLLVLDTDRSDTLSYADEILPIATFAETDGTFTNFAGRVQRVRRAVPPPGEAKAGWEALASLAAALGANWTWSSSEQVFAEIGRTVAAFSGFSSYREVGARGAMLGDDSRAGG
jgi:NADH-quinone oxidoreductase subunit G